ncbi:MAG: ABC transporter permease [Erysipelotrichaceae bacterium]|nr:ABC transporter permease [Erysipelotrichaceae bacterium]
MKEILKKIKNYQFLFEELVKRDFKTKYKGTWLGVLWSVLLPLMMFLVMRTVFIEFFGRTVSHYTTYLLAGYIVFNYYSDATKSGMKSLRQNARIIQKVNIPKFLFVLAKNVQVFISFLLNLLVFLIFVKIDDLHITWKFITLLYPIVMLLMFNVGVGFLLSALYTFFRDMSYFYDVVVKLVSYMSAIFYNNKQYSLSVQYKFFINPIYCFIYYFRSVVIDGIIPPMWLHALIFFDALFVLSAGLYLYDRYNTRFLFYL